MTKSTSALQHRTDDFINLSRVLTCVPELVFRRNTFRPLHPHKQTLAPASCGEVCDVIVPSLFVVIFDFFFFFFFFKWLFLNSCWTPTRFTVCTAQKRGRQNSTITQSNQHKSASLQIHRKAKLDLYISLVSFSFQRRNLWRETCFGHH